jgi:hypothetical protein
MNLVKTKFELQKEFGLPRATSVLVIQTIENEKVKKVDLLTVTKMWNEIYRELSFNNSTPMKGSVFQSYAGLVFYGQVKMCCEISIETGYSFGRNYEYIKTAIGILKSNYDHRWPSELKASELWDKVFDKLKRKRIAHNSQLNVLKALIKNDLIVSISAH